MYIADTNNYRVRKVTISTGIITTIAGTGTGGFSGDNGPASSAALNNARAVSVDSSGRQIIFTYHFSVLTKSLALPR